MAYYMNDDLEYLLDDYFDMIDYEGNHFEVNPFDAMEGDMNIDTSRQKTDTCALEVREGKDMQGIPWERLNYRRDEYRRSRLRHYKNYENLSSPRNHLEKECKVVEKGNFYDFQFNTRMVKSTILHFQLRNLLWATSKHDVYLMHNYSIVHWSPLLCRSAEVLSVAGQLTPRQTNQRSSAKPLSRVQISTMAVKNNLLVAGGFQGEVICKCLDQQGVAFCSKVLEDENAITNAVDIYLSSCGSTRVMTANNDNHVRVFDGENFSLLNSSSFPWSVNSTSISPDGKLLAAVGDSTDGLIVDSQSGKVIEKLVGHLDYSFACAWHPNGQVLATGNQDTTCRIWDTRKLSESLSVLKGNMGAIRGIKFSSDGKFMAMAEPADFVHIYDAQTDFCKAQEIDLFGEIAGVSFSPDTEALFISVADRNYGSLLEFHRRHQYQYLDLLV